MPKIEWFLAQAVASTYHNILSTVINNESKHAIEKFHRVESIFLIHSTDNLCVALCSQCDVAQILFLQFKEVVHLTVEDDADIVGINERLVAAGIKVDDRQTHMSQCQSLAIWCSDYFHARMVGTTEVHHLQFMFYNTTLIASCRSKNSTHTISLSLYS